MKRQRRPNGLRGNRRTGMTLIEMLVGALITTLLGAGLWTLVRSSYDSEALLLGQNSANTAARQAMDTLADKLRGAQPYASDGNAAIKIANASDITCYTNSSGDTVRLWRDTTTTPATLKQAVTTGGTTTTTLFSGLQSLAFTYWSWDGTTWATSETTTSRANLVGVSFTANVTVDGTSRQLSGCVRLRQKRY